MPSGGGGTPGGSSAGLMLPPGQDQAAAQWGNLANMLVGQGQNALSSMGGQSPSQWAYPAVQGTAQNILSNPYAAQPLTGAQNALNIFEQQLLPQSQSYANALSGIGGQAAASMPFASNIFSNQMYDYADNMAKALAPMYSGDVSSALNYAFQPSMYQSAISPLIQESMKTPDYASAGPSIMAAAMDPQNQLYNRTAKQLMDQTGAALSASGAGSSPYGSSVLGNTMSNFNIDWQNNLLNRMMSGSQAAKGIEDSRLQRMAIGLPIAQQMDDAALSRLTAGTNAALNLGQSAIQSYLQPAQSRAAGTALGASSLSGLGNAAGNAYTTGSNILGNTLQAYPGMSAAPYGAYNAIQNANLGALQNEIGLGNSMYQVPNQAISDLMQYMGLGQGASQIANSIGAQNFGQGLQTASGIGQLGMLGANALGQTGTFGSTTPGLFSAGGILGSQGPLFGTAADASIAAGGPPLAAAAPLAMSP